MRDTMTGRQALSPALALMVALAAAACSGCAGDGDPPWATSENLLVAWTSENGSGWLGEMSMKDPWRFRGAALPIGSLATMRCANGDLYVLSHKDGTVALVDIASRQVQLIASLGSWEPIDIVVGNPGTAYITRRTATHLLRLDVSTGATTEVVDLSLFADSDGIPDLGMMAVHNGRLFVQIRRANVDGDFGHESPPYLAVIDLASEKLIDTEPGIPGIQAIELLGTAPKHKMQVIAATAELFLSASGAMHDHGGIEVIDLTTLRSKGLVISEAFDAIGADLGSFIMVSPDEGFLVSSTDLDSSSHLQRFTVDGGVDPPPDLAQSIGYAAPSLALDARRQTLFFPSGEHGKMGIIVVDVASGDLLTPASVQTNGRPTDILPSCARS